MYTNGIHPYHRAPHILFGFPTRYTARKITGQIRSLEPVDLRKELAAAYARVGSDLTDGLFMSSRDGVRFHRWDEAFMRPGPEPVPGPQTGCMATITRATGCSRQLRESDGAPGNCRCFFAKAIGVTAPPVASPHDPTGWFRLGPRAVRRR
ncbi:MAG: hypothetical protein Ct9H300mP1_06430 [Planctomycetaceae bacterium]|nr:MAG: hypothetical protein Ct9H300mP1_06430 [Planctomycetaceae bacterium]